jgi:hypothetical protein
MKSPEKARSMTLTMNAFAAPNSRLNMLKPSLGFLIVPLGPNYALGLDVEAERRTR